MDVNPLPGTAPQAVPAAPAAAGPAPVAVPVVAAPPAAPAPPPPEVEVYRMHVSMLRRYPLRCAGYFFGTIGLLALAGYVNAYHYESYWFLAWVLLAAGLLLGARGVYWWLKMYRTSMVVTNRRLLLQSGLFTTQATEFPLQEVSDIQIDQGIMQRMLNVGDLVIVSMAGEERRQIVVMAVPNPLAVAGLIREAKETHAHAHHHH